MARKEKSPPPNKEKLPYLDEEGRYVSKKRPWLALFLNKAADVGEKLTGSKQEKTSKV